MRHLDYWLDRFHKLLAYNDAVLFEKSDIVQHTRDVELQQRFQHLLRPQFVRDVALRELLSCFLRRRLRLDLT